MRQRPRRNRNKEFYGAHLACSSRDRFLTDLFLSRFHVALPQSIDAPFPSFPPFPRPMRSPSARANPRSVMHYETRNDESAYVSHVMEIPLLIRALNDSATPGVHYVHHYAHGDGELHGENVSLGWDFFFFFFSRSFFFRSFPVR